MSRSAHARLPYPLRKLPYCARCRNELVLITVSYDEDKDLHYEWECPKCKKHIAQNLLNENPGLPQDQRLHEWCLKNQKRDEEQKQADKAFRTKQEILRNI